ncbi:MAG: peptidylprolyl isomerase, partial [Gemmatimonadota bacterium]
TSILASEVEEQVFTLLRGQPAPTDPKIQLTLRQQALGDLIDLELMFVRASADTMVKVTEEEVTSAVDELFRKTRQDYPSDQAFREQIRVTGFQTPEEYRQWLTDRQRKQLMANRLLEYLKAGGKIKPVIPTDREMRAYWESQKASQQRPETMTFRQIVVTPKASEAARTRAIAIADSILTELRRGEDFATAARRCSQDPGSKDQGGSLGWFRRGAMEPKFEEVAFRLRVGVVSDPVETPFGIHLIQVERVQPAEVLARHILIIPEITLADADSARARAVALRSAIAAGASFDSAQRVNHDSQELREIRDLTATQLIPAYAEPMEGLKVGELSEVFAIPVEGAPLRTKFAVVRMVERRLAGEFTYEDVKDTIRSQLGEQMALRRFLDGLRNATYVDVRGR